MIGVSTPQERTRLSQRALLPTVLAGMLAVGTPAVAQDHVHDTATATTATALPHGIPDFCAVPGAVMSSQSGPWMDPATWGGSLPGPNDVRIIAPGHDVTINSQEPAVRVLCVEGSLRFAANADTRLTVGTMLVKAGGRLHVGTSSAPINAANTAEIVVANTMLNDPLWSGFNGAGIDGNWVADPEQFGTGILSLGETTIHGAAKAPTWSRVAVEPKRGDLTLTLEASPIGWRAGDRIILPDTRHLLVNEVGDDVTLSQWTRRQGQWEELTIASISDNVVTLTSPLAFNHDGARDADNKLVLLPHVGNLSRNVIIRSESPINAGGVKGHVLFTHRANVDVRYAAFRDLGRTQSIACEVNDLGKPVSPACSNGIEPHVNQLGRYPVHFHHLIGPEPGATPANGHQFTFSGNAIDGGSAQHTRRWSVAIHASHYGLISDNVAYNYAGALFNTEDGTESYNVIERNFAVRSSGTGGRLGFGNEGMGFWFRGPNNYVRGNVAADFDSDNVEAAYGYKYFMHGACIGCDSLATMRIPTEKGQDPAQYATVNGNNLPILQFENNEVYSAAEGLTYWWLSSTDPVPSPNPKVSVFKDLRIWHVYNIGIYHYPGARVLFDGLQIYGDARERADFYACCGRGFHGEDYAATDVRIINSKIHNVWSPIIPSAAGTGRQIVENSELKNNRWNDVGVDPMFSANGPDWLPARKIILNNVNFRGDVTISKDWAPKGSSNLFQTDQLLVYGYRGNQDDDFEVFFDVQAQPGSTFAGGPAPCNLTRGDASGGIQGIVCETEASRGPVITWLDPWEGSTAGGTIVKIAGANFKPGARVTFGGVAASVRSIQPNEIEVRVPPHFAESVTVKVENTDLRSDELPSHYDAEIRDGVFVHVPIGFTFSTAIEPPPPTNTAPVANNDAYTTAEDVPLIVSAPGVLANDSDADGDSLQAVIVSASGPANGTLTLNNDGSFTYTPNAGFSGSDGFSYKVTDGTDGSNEASVTITVTPVNHPPLAVDDAAPFTEDDPGRSIDVLLNDTDPDGDPLQVLNVTAASGGAAVVTANGRQVFYTPNPNFCGIDTFDYTVSDGHFSDIGTVTVNVTCVQDPPRLVPDSFSVPEDSVGFVLDVLANDSDADGDALRVEACSANVVNGENPHGQVVVAVGGTHVIYTPDPNYFGPASFTCRIGAGPNTGPLNAPTARVTINVTAVNDAPVAQPQSLSGQEDTLKSTSLTATDVDNPTGPFTFAIASQPAHGTVSLIGSIARYTPNADFNGLDSFTFTASDGSAVSAPAAISINVLAVNDPPIARDNAYFATEDTDLVVGPPGVLGNDTDVDNDILRAIVVTPPAQGTLLFNENGTFTYKPAPNAFGRVTFTYKVNDGKVDSNIVPVVIDVAPVNDAPVAQDNNAATDEDTPVTFALLATDVDSTGLTYSVVVQPSHGTVTIANGVATYTPAPNYNGSDLFSFQASDGSLSSNVGRVYITVRPVNDAPVLAPIGNRMVAEGATLSFLVSATDVDNAALIFSASGLPQGALFDAAGNFSWTPGFDQAGSYPVTFTVSDGNAIASETITIVVTNSNRAPVATDDSFPTSEGVALSIAAPGVLANDVDADGGPLTVVLVSGAQHGVAVLNGDGSFTYTPELDFSGADTFTYMAVDASGAMSNIATVTVLVSAVNDAPVAAPDAYSTGEDGRLEVTAAEGVLHNDSDVDSATLTAIIVSMPSHGALTLNADGSFTYVPAADFNGTDTFSYKANDGEADSNTVDVTITVDAVNDPPTASDDSYSVNEDTTLSIPAPGVLGNDRDIDGNPLSAAVVAQPQHGSLTLNANGSFTYAPAGNFNGSDSFTYKVNDGSADSGVATVSIVVNAVNDAPVAASDAYSTAEDVTLNVAAPGVLGSDTDIDGDALRALLVNGPAHGTLALNADGSFSYTPAADFNGADSFTYKANDGSVDSNAATVTITIGGENDPPVAQADSYMVNEDARLNVAAPGLLSNDSDIDSAALQAQLVSGPAHGTLSLNANGAFSYTPAANYNGPDSFTYRTSDGSLSSNVTTVSITVNAVDDAPAAGNDAYSVAEDTALNVAAPGVLGNDRDVEGDAFTAVVVSQPAHGTLTLNADGSFSYSPAPNFNGTDSFSYRAANAGGESNVATVTLNVSAVNDAPTITTPPDQAGQVGTAVSLSVSAQDIDGDALTFSSTTLPPGLSLNAVTGLISGTLTTEGTFMVTVNVTDTVASASTTFAWMVEAASGVLVRPDDQVNRERDRVALQLQTTLPRRDATGNIRREFSAVGLPPGLKIDRDGIIDGRLQNDSAGTYNVTVTVTFGDTRAAVNFQWKVTEFSKPREAGDHNRGRGSDNSGPGGSGGN